MPDVKGFASECPRIDRMSFPVAPIILSIVPVAVAFASQSALASGDDSDRKTCLERSGVECGGIEVVDGAGRPVPDARVTWWFDDPAKDVVKDPLLTVKVVQEGRMWGGRTNSRGRAFAKQLATNAGVVEVQAPDRDGGPCAGSKRRRWTWRSGQSPARVVLKIHAFRRSDLRGRVIDAGGDPVQGANIRLLEVRRKAGGGADCSVSPVIEATSGADGAFVLGSVLHGEATFVVKHASRAEREVALKVPGPVPDVVLDRGTTWKGRILRPDGSLLERCEIGFWKQHPPTFRETTCSPTGFILHHLPAGVGEILVSTRAKGDPQLGPRVVKQEVQIQLNELREEDFRWPSGETIAGRVVTQDGVPVPAVWISAVPISTTPLKDGSGYGVGTTSDAKGHFVFRHLTFSGPWMLKFIGSGNEEFRMEVAAGTTNAVLTRRNWSKGYSP